jgi:hypothetical protein
MATVLQLGKYDKVDNYAIGQHPDIIKAMHAIQHPPSAPSDEAIDIGPSLDYIINLGDNVSAHQRIITKNGFFIGISYCMPPFGSI